MKIQTIRVFTAGVLAASLVLAGFGMGALRQSRESAQTGTAVAVIDLSRVLEGLQEPKDRDADRRGRAAKITEELNKAGEDLERLQKETEELVRGSQQWRDKMLRLRQEAAALVARRDAHQQFLDREQLEFLRELYMRIADTGLRIAKRDGWELVIWDDRSLPVPMIGGDLAKSATALDNSITSRRVLHAADRVDLTAQIITVMNNEYQAGRRN